MGKHNRNTSSPVVLNLLFSLIILSFSSAAINVVQIQAKKLHQTEALSRIYKAKSKPGSSGIDTAPFKLLGLIDDHQMIQEEEEEEEDGMLLSLKEKDRIEKLPGQPEVKFSQYGGYVTVDQSAGRALYYYFVEAHHSKDSLPLLLWLNGGPGCSSLAYGAMQELGPFRVHSDGKSLYSNRFSWNYATNVLFIESPAGVGFSYSNTTSDYAKSGDRKTAEDNYVFLVNWLERFPEYKGREFYISGESYAGHYVPQLAHTILSHNKLANKTIINLKGIIMGNAVIDDVADTRGMFDYFGSHALISEKATSDIRTYCNFSDDDGTTKKCEEVMAQVDKDTSNLNIYNIYAPSCFLESTTPKPKKASLMEFDPCSDYYVYAYLNRADVQEALHANVTKLTHDWEPCSDIIKNWSDSPSTMIPLLREFMANGVRVWIFSGDMDGRIPVTSTQYSLHKMQLSVKTEWHPWCIAGEEYKGGITFATVRGAGHQVPSYQPLRALSLIKHFLDGTSLPDTSRYS